MTTTRGRLLGAHLPPWVLLSILAILGCASHSDGLVLGPKGSSAAKGPEGGVAGESTWLTLSAARARLRVPRGWSFAREPAGLAARPPDGRATLLLFSAESRLDLAAALRDLGERFGLDKVELGKGEPVVLHGLRANVHQTSYVLSRGQPAALLLLVADAPSGRGVVVVFVVASDATDIHDQAIVGAINSLRAT